MPAVAVVALAEKLIDSHVDLEVAVAEEKIFDFYFIFDSFPIFLFYQSVFLLII